MAMHFAGSPVSFMANVHCAAATENFVALEHHSMDVPWWESMVTTTGGGPIVEKGFAVVPDAPGLGVERGRVRGARPPAAGQRVLRADAAVGQAAGQRPALELKPAGRRTEDRGRRKRGRTEDRGSRDSLPRPSAVAPRSSVLRPLLVLRPSVLVSRSPTILAIVAAGGRRATRGLRRVALRVEGSAEPQRAAQRASRRAHVLVRHAVLRVGALGGRPAEARIRPEHDTRRCRCRAMWRTRTGARAGSCAPSRTRRASAARTGRQGVGSCSKRSCASPVQPSACHARTARPAAGRRTATRPRSPRRFHGTS